MATYSADYPRQRTPIHVGRRVFLGAMAVGLAGLVVGFRKFPGIDFIASGFSVNGFQIYDTSGYPAIDAKSYALKVDGMVNSPSTYSLADLMDMPQTHIVKDYHCVTGWVVPNCKWTGIKLSDFLARVRPTTQAKYLLLASADGSYTESLSLDQANLPDVLLGHSLNGKPLSRDQGFPLRLVIPDMYGFKYIKWVNHITLSDHMEPGYWEQRGYAVDAWLGPRGNYGYA
jgi:DMSO/TMAO reductase YedYZ molybdopterin-dependent catalytic subunit